MKALLLRTWPRKATNEVTKESSISLAKIVVRRMASEGWKEPWLEIDLPYRGDLNARPRKMPEKTVENRHIATMLTETHVNRE